MGAIEPSEPAALPQKADLLVIGGGIIGAGIALEAARRGARVLLAEARDFAWGTSSRSSKLVHGGLRYLAEGQFALTRESVRERRALLADAPVLVQAQRCLMLHYKGRKPGWRKMGAGLALYDAFAGQRTRRFHDGGELDMLAPEVRHDDLIGGWSHLEAKTDDARLVLRVLHEARAHGAVVRNYLRADSLLREGDRVVGAVLADANGATQLVHARAVINATGVWADDLRGQLGAAPLLRPLRGSHLLMPLWRLPLAHAITLMHPRDGRPVFAYPWEGAALIGTTDLDHDVPLSEEPAITEAEVAYLIEATRSAFPSLNLSADDVISTFAGVRPVVAGGAADPSKESRNHIVLDEQGLLTVTGGKLTTFRLIALDALRHAKARLPEFAFDGPPGAIFAPVNDTLDAKGLPPPQRRRLIGRYGAHAMDILACAQPGELEAVPGSDALWAELRWSARTEWVHHLDDLLLRRTRLGLVRRGASMDLLPRLTPMLQIELGWDATRLAGEVDRYRNVIVRCYALPAARRMQPNNAGGDAR